MRAIDLADEMARRGLIAADAEPLPFGTAGRPWYVSAVLGGAGWLASLFGFLFVAMLFEPDTTGEILLAGVVMLGAGFGLYAADRDSAFFEQLALALSLAGQIALIWAVGDATESAAATAGFTALLTAALTVALPNRFARLLSTFFACIAWALTIRLGWWGEDSFGDPELAVALVPALIGWIVIWVPVGLGVHMLIERETEWMATDARRIARPALTGLLLALSLGTWTSEPFAALTFWTPPGQRSTSWLALWPLLGVAAALFAAVYAYRLRHRAMIGAAITGALLHVVQFYYLLGVRLVTKSYIMLAVGALLLLAAGRARRSEPAGGGAPMPDDAPMPAHGPVPDDVPPPADASRPDDPSGADPLGGPAGSDGP